MPPSPAFRCSPGRESRSDSHKRGRSLESGLHLREKDEDLALFSEMQSREKEGFLLQPSDDLEDSFSQKLRHFSDIKLGISIPGRGETSELLNADGDKNDYDWLLTPPDTPLFPSLDDEPAEINVVSRGRPRSKPISISRSSTMERSYKSSRGSASPNRLSSSPRSGNNTLQSRGRSSLTPNSSPTQVIRQATPTRRPSPPPTKPATPVSRSSTPTPRRISTGSGSPAVSSGIRGTSPVKTSRGNSASPKIRAWQTNIPGFSSEAPPNLRTSLADRPASYVRGSSPASRNSRDSTSKLGRQSMSPTPSRSSSYINSHDRDQFSSRSKGSVISSGDDDLDSLQSIPVGSLDRYGSRRGGSFSNSKSPSISKKPARMVSPSSAPKRSFDSALRQMDKKSPQNMFRPLLSSVPSTTFYVGKANSAQRSLVSRNSSVTTSSNASSDHGTSFAPDTEGSDHNQEDASETEKIVYADVHEEVFSFDKTDVLNANIEHEIIDESVDVLHHKTIGPMIGLGPTESETFVYHSIDKEFSESLETSDAIVDISETSAFENTEICSNCGCPLEATDQTEKNLRLCQECSRKTTLLRHIIPDATLSVSSDNSVNSTSIPTEEKPSHETDQLAVESRLSQENNVSNVRFPLGEPGAEANHTFPSEYIWDNSQQNPLSSSVERNEQTSTNQLEVDQSGVDSTKPDNHSGEQQLSLSKDRSILKADLLEGTGISVLLKRSNSSKGPVIQGRTFTATTLSYDDLSFARNSINSIRSSTGRSSYSTSSSVDFSSTRHSDFRVQRQSSGRKLDVDYGYDVRIRPPSPGSSFSGMSTHSYHGLGFTTQETSSGNTECSNLEGIPQHLREMQASENTVTDVIDSSMSSIVAKEDNLEYHDRSRTADACISVLVSPATGVRPDHNSVASFPNHESCILSDRIEDHPNNVGSVPNTETSVQDAKSSFDEENDMENSNVDGLDALVTTNTSTIEESEIDGEKFSQNDTGVVDDDPSLVSKCPVDDFQEPSVSISSSDSLAASVSELNASEYSHGIEGSTVTVECQDGVNTRSLTLEEATDTILFCSSIIHDLAYKAATISMEKEHSEPLEGSEPTVTILGKPNSDIKDTRSQIARKRAMKPQKARPKMVETDVKSESPTKTENDENTDESLIRNVGLPNKIDSMKPPNKLESKCNCIIM
ncbi:flocculation protein FLO11 [Vigna unguiculata]|uniref:flocculation protein FLO11 n=1 Tax=Vigna unguiculata TaxID=3917 RepID=UPI001016C034|nr:flocculation protein FLO11 [Vigna unguiculata]XP_027919128.1 flocculation protein FLO11 [Vigna unguiculata]XP_027919129.1 flocculation protein FLO11 [Vigna unguiculata]XP_027919131.1 flocculation protein FLO11 [Vigna unguiculata]XP_027919132.1 flocculation protein FLO11 [Vigna unguiculata]XP_027919133.1 flocculation protein FLO11 [Vigna unguiculata]XP_027919134.1 flocculation protein FLO11 [Vigna unguiculata]